jgi:hypothetical protein
LHQFRSKIEANEGREQSSRRMVREEERAVRQGFAIHSKHLSCDSVTSSTFDKSDLHQLLPVSGTHSFCSITVSFRVWSNLIIHLVLMTFLRLPPLGDFLALNVLPLRSSRFLPFREFFRMPQNLAASGFLSSFAMGLKSKFYG